MDGASDPISSLRRSAAQLTDVVPAAATGQLTAVVRGTSLLQRIVEDGRGVVGRYLADLRIRAGAVSLDQPCADCRREFADLLRIAAGESEENLSLGDFLVRFERWIAEHDRVASEIRQSEERFGQIARVRGDIARLDELFASPVFRAVQSRWEKAQAQANRALENDTNDAAGAAEVTLLPFLMEWEELGKPGGLAARYTGRRISRLEGAPERPICARLIYLVEDAAKWLVAWDPATFVPSAAERELSDLEQALEVQLLLRYTPVRASTVGPAKALDEVLEVLRARPDDRAPTAEAQDAIASLLERAAREGGMLSLLARVLDLGLSDEAQAGICKRALERIVAEDTFWIPPKPGDESERRALEALARHAPAHALPARVALRLVVARRDWLGIEPTDPGPLECGAFGCWLRAAMVTTLDPSWLESRSWTDPAALAEAVAFALVPKSAADDERLRPLLAALELAALLSGRSIGSHATWLFIQQERDRLSTLAKYLEHVVLSSSAASAAASLATSTSEVAALARDQAAREVRPRHYRGVQSAESMSRSFVEDIAEPLLSRALAPRQPADTLALRTALFEARDGLRRTLAQNAVEFVNPPDGKVRAALERDCRDMLAAIELVLDADPGDATGGEGKAQQSSLADDLTDLRRRGAAAAAGADLFYLYAVEHGAMRIALPGDKTELDPALWGLPRCRKLWVEESTSLEDYAIAIEEDLEDDPSGFPNPVRWALGRAAEGNLAIAEEALGSYHGPRKAQVVEALAKERTEWEELFSGNLARLSQEPDLNQQEKQDVARAKDAAQTGQYGVACEFLEKVGDRLEKRRALALAADEELDRKIEILFRAALRCPDPNVQQVAVKRLLDLRNRRASLSASDIDEALRSIQQLIADPFSPEAVGVPEVSQPERLAPATAGVPVTTEAPGPGPGEVCYGIVRKAAPKFGLIRPVNTAEPEVHVDRSILPEGEDIPPGTLVVYGALKQVVGQVRPSAGHLTRVDDASRPRFQEELRARCGHREPDVGILVVQGGQRRIATDDDGSYVEADSPVLADVGETVRFEVFDREHRRARVVATADASSISPGRAKLIRMLFTDQILVKAVDATVGSIGTISPDNPSAIGSVLSLMNDARVNFRYADVVAEIERQRELLSPKANWLRAMCVEAYLRAPPAGLTPAQLLKALFDTRADWTRGNADACVAQVYKGIQAAHSEVLSADELRRFFFNLQDAQGANPLFRIEIVLARLSSVDLIGRGAKPDLKLALHHASRARVVNPRAAEGSVLEKQILERLQQEGLEHQAMRTGDDAPESWPDDPVEAKKHVTRFYRELLGAPDLKKASSYFKEHEGRASGLALNELVLQHAGLLLTAERPAEAEEVLLRHVRRNGDIWWGAVLERLFEAWNALRLSADRLTQAISALQVPEAWSYLISLHQAKDAFKRGDYTDARALAERSMAQTPSAEARHIIERSDAMLGTVLASQAPAFERKTAASSAVERAANKYADSPNRIVELALGYMSDPEVGPWLIHELVGPNGPKIWGNISADLRQYLVSSARSSLQAPSWRLVLADMEAYWSDGFGSERSAQEGLPEEIDKLLADSSEENLSAVGTKFGPWTAFALMDALSRVHRDNAAVRWHRAVCARAIGRTADFVDGALRAMLDGHPSAQPATIASALLTLALPGLALAVASLAPQGEKLVETARPRCRVQAWEAPSLLHKARDEESRMNWPGAMDLLVRALVNQPDNWATCRAFFETFTLRGQDDPRFGLALVRVGAAAAAHVALRVRGVPEPFTLEAELRFEESKLMQACNLGSADEHEALRASATQLCVQAQRQRTGFMPAVKLAQRLQDWGQQGGSVLAPGEVFCGYRVDRHIGVGSFGHVYRATRVDDPTAPPVALKVLRDEGDPERRLQKRDSLRREARTLMRLQHPNIVRTFDFIPDRCCLVLEFVEGKPLSEWREQGVRLSWRDVADVGLQVVQALAHAHDVSRQESEALNERTQRTFAHRDIHPGNIIMRKTDTALEVKVLDFGLARLPGGTFSTVPFKGVNHVGRYRDPNYGSDMDFRGDIFSLGVILYELLCGAPPYPDEEYSNFQWGVAGTGGDVATLLKSPRELAPDGTEIPAGLDEVLLRMVSFRATDRPRSLDALADEFLRLLTPPGAP